MKTLALVSSLAALVFAACDRSQPHGVASAHGAVQGGATTSGPVQTSTSASSQAPVSRKAR